MAASASASEKTEKATPKRREDERKKGNLFQSSDVISAVSILTIFLALRMTVPYIYRYFGNLYIQYLGYAKTESSAQKELALKACNNAIIAVLLLSASVMIVSVLVAVLAAGVQTRFRFSGEKIKFKFSNISPIEGMKRLFSLRSAVEVVKAIAKVVVVSYLLYVQIKNFYTQGINMMEGDVFESTVNMMTAIMNLVIQMSIAFIAMAVLDFGYQWWEYERNIRMTKQEVKEEYKELEGNPEIKSRIRQVQTQAARRRMMQQVPTADVVVRNPTHFAVALRYDAEKDNAPVVVAKGQDYIALKIIEIAQQHNIPMRENRPLARALYESVEVGREIPQEFYTVLAEIMAWVFQLKKEAGGA